MDPIHPRRLTLILHAVVKYYVRNKCHALAPMKQFLDSFQALHDILEKQLHRSIPKNFDKLK